MKKQKTQNKGITLIALVITIIVMLILVAVTISMAVNGGLFDYAGRAVSETNNALKAEGQLAEGGVKVGDTWYNSIDEYLATKGISGGGNNIPENVEKISKTEDKFIGCYADVDGNGTVDGVIYVDLAFDRTIQWSDMDPEYEINNVEDGLKDYYISQEDYEGDFGTADVLAPVGSGINRFYVMALSDAGSYTWYSTKTEWESLPESTGENIGTGKTNTTAMIGLWKADTDANKSNNDVWGNIQTQANSGWFLPSKGEWCAFADALNISTVSTDARYYVTCGLATKYWTSSQYSMADGYAHAARFSSGDAHHVAVEGEPNNVYNVRLSTTF